MKEERDMERSRQRRTKRDMREGGKGKDKKDRGREDEKEGREKRGYRWKPGRRQFLAVDCKR